MTTAPIKPGAHPTRARYRTADIDGVGVFYREFGLTMAMSIVLSGVVARPLTPVL